MKTIWYYTHRVPPDHSGAGKRCVAHAKWFAEKGYNVIVLTKTQNPDETDGVTYLSLPQKSNGLINDYVNLYQNKKALSGIIKKYGAPDILHSFGGGMNSSVISRIGQAHNIKTVIEVVVSLPEDTLKYKFTPNRHLRMYGLCNADRVIANSDGVKSSITKTGFSKPVDVIYNPVNMQKFSPVTEEESKRIRKDLNLPEESFLILMVGRVCLRKGHDIALKTLNKLKEHTDVKLVFVGPWDHSGLNQIKSKLSASEQSIIDSDKIIWAGQTDRVADYYCACNLLLFPSRKEGLPNVPIEAMASGLPVVASPLKGANDVIIDHEETGFITNENRTDEFIRYINRIIDAPESLEKMKHEGPKRIKSKFSESVIYDQYEQLYKEITD